MKNSVHLETQLSARNDVHLLRKIWHMATGSLGLIIHFQFNLTAEVTGTALAILGGLGFILEFSRLKIDKINKIYIYFLSSFMRESEKTSVNGMPFYALGCGLSLLLFSFPVAIISILFLVFSDPFSSLIGSAYGKDKFLPNKSIQGSLAGFGVCFIITLLMTASNTGLNLEIILFSLLAGVIGSFSEIISALKVDDNITIPIVSGLGLTLLNNFFQIL